MGQQRARKLGQCCTVLCTVAMLLTTVTTQHPFPPPPNLNLENLPNTTFSCEGKVVGGYYADVDTDCQMFHVCTLGQKGETQDIKFLCLQGTVFDQVTRVCERSEEVNCQRSGDFFDINKELYHESNKEHVSFNANITDSNSEASIAHAFLPDDSPFQSTQQRFSVLSAAGSGGQDYDSAGVSTRTVQLSGGRRSDFRGRTRNEVPLFSPPRAEQRQISSLTLPRLQPFSRFRETRLFGEPRGQAASVSSSASSFGGRVSSATRAPILTTRSSSPAPTILTTSSRPVPLIPAKDPHRPRVVVTNGKPFVPKLDSSDPLPALHAESKYHSLALPDTNFTCADKVSGGHYADPETGCRMFHICVMGPNDTITDYKLLCGNSTVFEQKSRTCQEEEKVDCASSALNYYVNNHLIVPKWLANMARNGPPAMNGAMMRSHVLANASRMELAGHTRLSASKSTADEPTVVESNEHDLLQSQQSEYSDSDEYYTDYIDYYYDYDYPNYFVSTTEHSEAISSTQPTLTRRSDQSASAQSASLGDATSISQSTFTSHRTK